jgi:DNA (cytosine-5)-methyltransferase 1
MTKKILVADLLCGAGGSSTGCARALAELGLKMELVCVNHWPVALDTHSKNHPEARHYCQDIATVRPHLIVPEGYLDLLMASPTCFPAGTLVMTERGFEPIETVEPGVRVLTHKGRWRRVSSTMRTEAPTVLVRGHGHFGIETTADHPFLACERRLKHRYAPGSGRHRYTDPAWVPAASLKAKKHFWATPTRAEYLPVPEIGGRGLKFSPEFWWFVGRWLGDGYFGERKAPRNAAIIICCGHSEHNELAAHLNFAPAVGPRAAENELRWSGRKQPTGYRFDTEHEGLMLWLKAHFGKLAHGKRLPAWALTMPERDRRAMLEGYLSADGWGDHRKCETNTVSKSLALGMRLLAESLGHRVAMHLTRARQNPIEGRKVSQRDQYHLVWVRSRQHNYGGESDGLSWLRVRSVTPTNRTVPVFNISVEEDESYVAEGIVVHNCTHHSVARGGKPTSDQQRSDPWHIVTWLTELRVKRMIIENVWEFCGWGPVDARTGKPIPSRKGEYFRAWIDTIRRLGYDPEWRKLNAADFGDATTRQRFILMARSDKRSVSWPIPTHRKKIADELLLFPGIKPWRPARDIIDWNIKGNSIFNRKKPLAPKTLARIMAGAVKFGWPEPFLVILRNHMAGQSVDGPVPTMTTAKGGEFAIVMPVTHHDISDRIRDAGTDPLPTVTGANRGELAFITAQHGERQGQSPRVHDIDQPAPTIAATGHVDLIQATPEYDILFRMLEPHELAAAMGFDSEEATYEFAGTKTEKIKQIGNAVSVSKMKACVGAIMADAAPKAKAVPADRRGVA